MSESRGFRFPDEYWQSLAEVVAAKLGYSTPNEIVVEAVAEWLDRFYDKNHDPKLLCRYTYQTERHLELLRQQEACFDKWEAALGILRDRNDFDGIREVQDGIQSLCSELPLADEHAFRRASDLRALCTIYLKSEPEDMADFGEGTIKYLFEQDG